ncbi:hypothetical protein P153DRAFT_354365 [Dothidotthia symphoricarpi CBS 119687]|uniref:Uncharacterized protein n=1 Tax=Dothidotthia symphoricarpi CBS 119687 TaxID=1392245 RepID=A0A6A6AMA0_9PLEO|nr:uncharacterized protein P153DRAFT_354365 [Dothidotthia symphoricarpi CBS 119687]KAF2132920.1 hypothetical protein P153DRAFT_354365 [Dothidotthia symphoricarpi CBS 119687]
MKLLILTTLLPTTLATLDPKTLNPTHLSLLSVLRTGIPSSFSAALPTASQDPQWYIDLPLDVKELLPQLYPLSTSTSTSPSPSASTAAVSDVPQLLESETPTSTTTQRLTSRTTTVVTRTVGRGNAGTGIGTGISGGVNGTGGLATSTSSSTATETAVPSGLFSAGAGRAVGVEVWAGVCWVGVGVGFFAFA